MTIKLLSAISLLCVAATPGEIEVELGAPICDPQIEAAKSILKTEHDSRIRDLKLQHQATVATLEAKITQLRARGRAILAECAVRHFENDEKSSKRKGPDGDVRLYLQQASVCGDYGLLHFSVAPLVMEPRYRIERVEVTPPGGLPTTQATLRTGIGDDGSVVAVAVFDVQQQTNGEDEFAFRFVGQSGKTISASGVSFPLAAKH